jgi:hypothetical protein
MTDYAELERLAREARHRSTSERFPGKPSVFVEADVVLALLEERRALREALLDLLSFELGTSRAGYDAVISKVRAALQAEPAQEGAPR